MNDHFMSVDDHWTSTDPLERNFSETLIQSFVKKSMLKLLLLGTLWMIVYGGRFGQDINSGENGYLKSSAISIFCMFLYKVTASLAGLISVTLDDVTSWSVRRRRGAQRGILVGAVVQSSHPHLTRRLTTSFHPSIGVDNF